MSHDSKASQPKDNERQPSRRFAVIVAAGAGTRLGLSVPKAYCEIEGRSLLSHSLAAFLGAIDISAIALVIPRGWEAETTSQVNRLRVETASDTAILIQPGGESRHDSVRCGVECLRNNSQLNSNDVIAIHDAARCLVTASVLESCYAAALTHGAATAATAIRDTVKRARDGCIVSEEFISRDGLYAMQTPQIFKYDYLQRAFSLEGATSATDEVSLVQTFAPAKVIEATVANFKITVPQDLEIAGALLRSRK